MSTTTNRIFTRSLLGAILVFFLMPFTTLTCGGTKLITMSGVQLATGTTTSSKEPFSGKVKKEKIKPEPCAAIAIVAAVLALGLSFMGGQSGKISMAIFSTLCGATLLFMKFKIDQEVLDQGKGMLGVQWEFGYWMALITAIAAAVLSFIQDKKNQNDVIQDLPRHP